MTTPRFTMRRTRSIILCLAAVTMFCACGGNADKKQAADGATETQQVETKASKGGAVKEIKNGDSWPDNHFTQQVPKLDIPINEGGVSVSDKEVLIRINRANATPQQLAAYWEKVKAAGFTVRTMNATDGSEYSASNAAGYRVSLTKGQLFIRKERADGY